MFAYHRHAFCVCTNSHLKFFIETHVQKVGDATDFYIALSSSLHAWNHQNNLFIVMKNQLRKMPWSLFDISCFDISLVTGISGLDWMRTEPQKQYPLPAWPLENFWYAQTINLINSFKIRSFFCSSWRINSQANRLPDLNFMNVTTNWARCVLYIVSLISLRIECCICNDSSGSDSISNTCLISKGI